MTSKNAVVTFILIFSGVFFAGCHKRVANVSAAQPAATPAPAAPTVTLNASPANIAKGGSTTLTWSSTNATRLTLAPGVGMVEERGSQQVDPNESTTYTITAMGNGGRADATASVTVTIPPVRKVSSLSLDEMFQQAVKDAFFDYNQSDIRADARKSLEKDAEFLDLHRDVRFTIEGHCDERGSEEYNLGLGDRRAESAKKYLVGLGIPEDHIQATSYGKERPFCNEHDEACWQQNRRGHFVMNR